MTGRPVVGPRMDPVERPRGGRHGWLRFPDPLTRWVAHAIGHDLPLAIACGVVWPAGQQLSMLPNLVDWRRGFA